MRPKRSVNRRQKVTFMSFFDNKIKNKAEFDELVKTMASSIGSPCNPTKLSNTFNPLPYKSVSPL